MVSDELAELRERLGSLEAAFVNLVEALWPQGAEYAKVSAFGDALFQAMLAQPEEPGEMTHKQIASARRMFLGRMERLAGVVESPEQQVPSGWGRTFLAALKEGANREP